MLAPSVKVGDRLLVRTGPSIEVLVGLPSTTVHDALAGLLKTGGNPGHTARTATVWRPTSSSLMTTGPLLFSHGPVSIWSCHRSHLGSETLTEGLLASGHEGRRGVNDFDG